MIAFPSRQAFQVGRRLGIALPLSALLTAAVLRRRRLAAPLAVAFVASALVVLSPSSSIALTTADIGDPGGPLTHIYITSQTNCQVAHTDDTNFELFPPQSTTGSCGTFLVVDPANEGGTLYGPQECAACDATGPRTPWTEVSQTQTGHSVETVVDAGSTGIRVTETDSYTPGQESFLTDIAIQNLDEVSHTLVLYRAGDCFLGDNDAGFGQTFPGGGIACSTSTEPNSRIEEWAPITSGSHYYETFYSSLWAGIGTHGDFPDTCDCDTFQDNGAGISWRTTILAGETATYSHLTSFSPTGSVVLTMTKTADSPTAPPGGQDGYTITVDNPNESDVALDSVSDDLPAGFSYVSGSTSGMTESDPSIEGQTLTWSGSFPVPAGGSASLHFNVVVAETPGEYFNQASATAEGYSVAPTGPTAPITVTGLGGADLSITKSDGNPDPCPGDPPISCGPDPVSSGQLTTYGVSVTNNGPDPATGITVTDTSEGGTVQSGSGTDWSCNPVVENTLTCHYTGNDGALPAGSTASPLTVVVRAPDNPGSEDITMTDTASVTAEQPDPDTENNSDSEDTTVLGTSSESSEDHAAGFFDNINTLTIATTRDETGRFYSSLTIFPDEGLEPGVVTIDEFPATMPPYNTLCGDRACDAQVQVTVLPAGQAGADNAMEVHLIYVKDKKHGSKMWVKGDLEEVGTVVPNCIRRGIADPPKCVNSKRILPNGDREIILLWRDGGDPWGGKR